MSLTIRSGREGDAAAFALAGKATFLDAYADILPAADILAHCERQHDEGVYTRWLADPAYRLWLAEQPPGAAPVGYAVLGPPDLPVEIREGDLELKRIYLLHRFQGLGVGAGLMAAALAGAQAAGGRRMLLGVYGKNDRAIAFYGRQGFVPVGVRKFRVGANDYDDLVLAREI